LPACNEALAYGGGCLKPDPGVKCNAREPVEVLPGSDNVRSGASVLYTPSVSTIDIGWDCVRKKARPSGMLVPM
jgi:hypothetical protein